MLSGEGLIQTLNLGRELRFPGCVCQVLRINVPQLLTKAATQRPKDVREAAKLGSGQARPLVVSSSETRHLEPGSCIPCQRRPTAGLPCGGRVQRLRSAHSGSRAASASNHGFDADLLLPDPRPSLVLTTCRGITEVCTACASAASMARLTHGFKPNPWFRKK